MKSTKRVRLVRTKAWLMGSSLLAGAAVALFAPAAFAQDPVVDEDQSDEIVVTGYRSSLQQSAQAKRDATAFTDSVFAEDIGKFPDTNLAESFNRIPGVTIAREISGEGLNVAIRGLGTNFTRVLLNGAPVAVASTGRTDAQNTNREVDLDMFPTELFTSLTVNKSAQANTTEGGAAGTVIMRSARPFDNPGQHLTYSFQGTKNSNADGWGERGSVIASGTWGDFGLLVGAAAVRNDVRVTGFETIGWTNANLTTAATPGVTAIQCTTAPCNGTGGGNWSIPQAVPANAGNGLTPGDPIDEAFLLANNPGLSLSQIDNAIIPRLGRPSDEFGTKERINFIASAEWRPSDNFHVFLDGIYGRRENDLERIDMNWVGRNGQMVPLNMTVDRDDCTQGCVVTGGTFANSQFFLEYRPFIEYADFWSFNPGVEWQMGQNVKFNLQGNWTESSFHRESPTVLVNTPGSSGVTVDYVNDGSNPFPTISTNVDLNDPASFVWAGGRVNIQDERRYTRTRGIRGDFTFGGPEFNVRVGGAWDDVLRNIEAYDNSQAWQNNTCGGGPSVFVPGPNTQPPCQGLEAAAITPGVGGYPAYPALGTGFSAGYPPLTYGGSAIPQSALANYLEPGPSGFVTVDWERFAADSGYDAFHDAAPRAGSSNTGASGGFVQEKVIGLFGEFNGVQTLGDGDLRYNFGLRWVHTNQTIAGLVSIADPRNADPDGVGPLEGCPGAGNVNDGSCYPNIQNFAVTTENSYDNFLPSGNFSYDLSDNALIRLALSRTMTRPNPNAMLPGLNFSTPSADVGSIGNPALDPFISNNIDIGFEYYTGGEGLIGIAAFRKTVKGFTVTGTTTQPFSFLGGFGVTYDTLTPTQQAAIDSRCGAGNSGAATCTVVLNQQVNASGILTVNGLEFTLVQPLDFIAPVFTGFGVTGNLTIIDQKGSGAAPAVAVGVSPYTYNVTAYYEDHGISARISKVFNKGAITSGTNQNGIPLAAIYGDDYGQWDFSSSFDLGEIFGLGRYAPQLTFDVINLFNADQRSYFQFENAAFTYYNPGRTIQVGLRGSF